MRVEFIGIARTADASETVTEIGAAVQPDYLYRIARAHERSGFDRVLITQTSSTPDGFVMADQVLNVTSDLGVLLVHRPGFVAPTAAARMFATLDALHPGRVALHASTGGEDDDQARDGDLIGKAARYRRTDEFLDVVRLAWRSPVPFDYAGEFYRVDGAWAAIRPLLGHLPIYFAGASRDAIRVGGRHADVYRSGVSRLTASESWSGGFASRRQRPTARSTSSASACGRSPRAPRPRPGGGRRDLLELARDQVSLRTGLPAKPQAEGSRRLLRYAADAELHDERLWTALARATGAPGNSTALVGSYEQVARSLLGYVTAGASSLLIRGYDPLADATAYGHLIRLVHEQVADDIDGYRARAAA